MLFSISLLSACLGESDKEEAEILTDNIAEENIDDYSFNMNELPDLWVENDNEKFKSVINTINWEVANGGIIQEVINTSESYEKDCYINEMIANSSVVFRTSEPVAKMQVFEIIGEEEESVPITSDGRVLLPEAGKHLYKIMATYNSGKIYYLYGFTIIQNPIKINRSRELNAFINENRDIKMLRDEIDYSVISSINKSTTSLMLSVYDKETGTIRCSIEINYPANVTNPIVIEGDVIIIKESSKMSVYDFDLNIIFDVDIPGDILSYLENIKNESAFNGYDYSYKNNQIVYILENILYSYDLKANSINELYMFTNSKKVVAPTFVDGSEKIAMMIFGDEMYEGLMILDDDKIISLDVTSYENLAYEMANHSRGVLECTDENMQKKYIEYDLTENMFKDLNFHEEDKTNVIQVSDYSKDATYFRLIEFAENSILNYQIEDGEEIEITLDNYKGLKFLSLDSDNKILLLVEGSNAILEIDLNYYTSRK